MKSFFAACAALLFAGVEAGRHSGSCSDNPKQGVESFSQRRYAGRWYDIAKEADFFDEASSCSVEDIVENFNGTVTIGKSRYDLVDDWQQKTLNAVRSANNRGEYIVVADGEAVDRQGNTDFYVLATDYETWAVEYICIDLVPGRVYFDGISIKGRQRELSKDTLDLVQLLIEGRVTDYDFSNLHYVHQCQICPFDDVPVIESE